MKESGRVSGMNGPGYDVMPFQMLRKLERR